MILKLFKKRWTKWIPFGVYHYAHDSFIVFVRKNQETGMMQFKTKRTGGMTYRNNWHIAPLDLLDVKKQWDIISNK